MSAIDFYLERGFTPMNKAVVISGPDTISVWTPITGKRVFVTNLSIGTNVGGTIAFYFDNGNSQIARFSIAGSASISPSIGCWDSTVTSGRIFARTLGNASDGWYVNLTGFEL